MIPTVLIVITFGLLSPWVVKWKWFGDIANDILTK